MNEAYLKAPVAEALDQIVERVLELREDQKTLIRPIKFDIDLDARSAHVSIPGVLESVGRPILSPATGQEHRVRINIPNGIEFEDAEIGSATTTATTAIRLDLADTYGQFNRLCHSGKGVVHA